MVSNVIIQEAVKAAAGFGGQSRKESSALSVEFFNFDFVNLTIKIFLWFLIAIVLDKIHFAMSNPLANVASTISSAFGYNFPKTEPDFFKKIFNEGYFGLKYWDFIKIGAIILVFVEFMRYYENEKRLGGKPSPFTIGIFILIMTVLSAFTVPEIIEKLKARRPNEVQV